jgi:hypothetical protein
MATIDWVGLVKQYLKMGGPNTPEQSALGTTIEAIGSGVQSAIENHIGKTLGPVTYTESYDGNDHETLFLAHQPINSVASLTLYGTALTVGDPNAPTYPPATVVINRDQTGIERTDGDVFWWGKRNILVTYNAGYVDVPAAIVQAGVLWAADIFKKRDRLGIQTEMVSGMQSTFTTAMPEFVALQLLKYQKTNYA